MASTAAIRPYYKIFIRVFSSEGTGSRSRNQALCAHLSASPTFIITGIPAAHCSRNQALCTSIFI